MKPYVSAIFAVFIVAGCTAENNNSGENPSDTGMTTTDTGATADTASPDDDMSVQDPDIATSTPTDMAAVDTGSGTTPLATDCPASPDDNTICLTAEGLGTQVFVFANAATVLSGSTTEADANLQDNTTIQVPIDVARLYDCSVTPDGSPANPIISINLGVNIYANDDTVRGWVGGNVIADPVCEIEFTTGAANSGDAYEGSFSATLIRAISITETDPSQTLRIAGTFRGIRP